MKKVFTSLILGAYFTAGLAALLGGPSGPPVPASAEPGILVPADPAPSAPLTATLSWKIKRHIPAFPAGTDAARLLPDPEPGAPPAGNEELPPDPYISFIERLNSHLLREFRSPPAA